MVFFVIQTRKWYRDLDMRRRIARFLIEEDLYQEAKGIATGLYHSNLSEYIRTLIRIDLIDNRTLIRVSLIDKKKHRAQNSEGVGSDKAGQ